jgi:bla regulator protein blaR1
MRHGLAIVFLSTVIAYSIYAQSSASFEAAIVRPSGPKSIFQSKLTRSEFIVTRHTLQMLIQTSYPDLPPWRISGGPSWATTDQWDLVAKLPAAAPPDQERLYRATEQMLRNFLAEEFRLETHFVQKEQPVYYLVLAKDGPKLKPSEAGAASFQFTAGGIEIRHKTMQEFTGSLYCPNCLRQAADRPVFDKTGLSGYYDLTLNWSPSNIANETAAAGPSIFTALEEQLGLKLQPGRATVDFLVIDRAERPQSH